MFKIFRAFYLSLVALLGLCGAIAVGNYAVTQGAGTNFGSVVVGGVHYAQQFICDLTTPAQCATVDASGNISVKAASGAYASGSIASGAYASGSIGSGAMVDLGAIADAAATAGSTGSVNAKLRLMTSQLDAISTNTSGAIPACGSSPCTTVIGAVTGFQGTSALSTTNGWYFNQLQGNAVLSATNPSFAAPIPTTSGGLSVYFLQPTASTNSNNIKASAGQVYKIDVFNNSATVHYIRLYNTATTGTCNSATNLVWQGIIPASTSGAGLSSSWDLGMAFSSGVALCVTSGYDGTGNATASALIVNIGYK